MESLVYMEAAFRCYCVLFWHLGKVGYVERREALGTKGPLLGLKWLKVSQQVAQVQGRRCCGQRMHHPLLVSRNILPKGAPKGQRSTNPLLVELRVDQGESCLM